MEDSVLQRIRKIIKTLKISDRKFAETTGLPQTTISSLFKRGNEPNTSIVLAIVKAYPNLNTEWLITGEGSMFKDPKHSNIFGPIRGDRNMTGNKIQGNVEFGNNINVSLPETGTQKIIKPDGSVELISADSSNLELENAKKEIEELRLTISHLKDNMSVKDELIASLKETIDLLKHRQ